MKTEIIDKIFDFTNSLDSLVELLKEQQKVDSTETILGIHGGSIISNIKKYNYTVRIFSTLEDYQKEE